MKTFSRAAALLLVFVLALCLCACGSTSDTGAAEEVTTGGWTAAAPAAAALDTEAQAAFDAVCEGYTPAALLATQVVSGTNYCFLAWSDTDGYVLLKVYEDLSCSCELLDTAVIDITADSFGTQAEEGLTGGWTAAAAPADALDAETADILAAADDSLVPYACLGTQIVSGTNYCFLCSSGSGLVLAYVYCDLNGNASVTETLAFAPADLLA